MSYELNSTEQLYIDKFYDILEPYGIGSLLKNTVNSIAIHAYEKGLKDNE